jgi:N-acetyl-gamma-glutamyl-phosphate reductase
MLKVAIMGANGYAGEELLRILVKHPEVKITVVAGKIEKTRIDNLYPWLKGILDLECADLSAEETARECDCVFLALPHKVSMQFVPVFLKKGVKAIDLSADFRLRDKAVYEKWYEKHTCPEYINKAVYGLPEFYRDRIKGAELIANPGCYPTSIILGCAPLLKNKAVDTKFIIADSKSGVSGAGRVMNEALKSNQMENSFRAYKVNSHRHMPEIDQELSVLNGAKVAVNFIPHLVPMERGIESTIYLRLKKKIDTDAALKLYKDFYRGEYFVRVMDKGVYPDTKNVVKQNFCDIGIEVFPEKEMAIVMTAIDNLTKGASGQAVQNMNIMYGFEEKTAL